MKKLKKIINIQNTRNNILKKLKNQKWTKNHPKFKIFKTSKIYVRRPQLKKVEEVIYN